MKCEVPLLIIRHYLSQKTHDSYYNRDLQDAGLASASDYSRPTPSSLVFLLVSSMLLREAAMLHFESECGMSQVRGGYNVPIYQLIAHITYNFAFSLSKTTLLVQVPTPSRYTSTTSPSFNHCCGFIPIPTPSGLSQSTH